MSGSWLSGTPTVLPSIRAAGGPPSEPPAQVSPVQHNDFPRRSTSKYTLFDHRAAVLLRDLAWSWKAGRPVALKGALRRVVGFGPGLTPSGDDFLVGLLAAATVFDAQNDMTEAVANEVCSLVSAGGACRAGGAAHATTDPPTTHPSIYMLVAAAGGYYPEPLAGLLEALAGKAGPGVAVRVARLSDLGATSGLDMLAGVLFWFEVSGMQRERCGECLTEAGAAAWKGGP